MKKLSKYILLIMAILLIYMIINPFEKYKKIDRYIKYNISSEVHLLFMTIEKLDNELLIDDKYKTMDLNEMSKVLREAERYVMDIDQSIGKLRLLNKNYDINLYGFEDYLFSMNKKVKRNIRPSEEDIETLKGIYQLRKKYSNAAIFGLYEDDKSAFTNMKMPEKTRLLFEGLNNLKEVSISDNKEVKLSENDKNIIKKYINETAYVDFSFDELLNKMNIRNKPIFIDELNIAVNSNGDINSINISYYEKDINNENMLIYRKEADLFKIVSIEKDDILGFKENTDILELVDSELKDIFNSESDIYIIDLLAPVKINNNFSSDNSDIYYNGSKIDNKEDIEGITFHVYGYPMNLKDRSTFYIFNE